MIAMFEAGQATCGNAGSGRRIAARDIVYACLQRIDELHSRLAGKERIRSGKDVMGGFDSEFCLRSKTKNCKCSCR